MFFLFLQDADFGRAAQSTPLRLWTIASYSSTFGPISRAKGNSFYERIKIFAIFIVKLTGKKLFR